MVPIPTLSCVTIIVGVSGKKGVYNGDIELRGDFIASNVTINGEKTKLFNNIFSTEVLEISNNGKYSTLNVSQLDTSYDIFNAYNNTGNVFTILGNGNIGIGTKNPSSILEVIGEGAYGIVLKCRNKENNEIGFIFY